MCSLSIKSESTSTMGRHSRKCSLIARNPAQPARRIPLEVDPTYRMVIYPKWYMLPSKAPVHSIISDNQNNWRGAPQRPSETLFSLSQFSIVLSLSYLSSFFAPEFVLPLSSAIFASPSLLILLLNSLHHLYLITSLTILLPHLHNPRRNNLHNSPFPLLFPIGFFIPSPDEATQQDADAEPAKDRENDIEYFFNFLV